MVKKETDYEAEIRAGEKEAKRRDEAASKKLVAQTSEEEPKTTDIAAETATEARKLAAEAELVDAKAKMTNAKGNLWKARSDNGAKAVKSAGKWLLWGSILATMGLFFKGAYDAVKGGADKKPADPEENRITQVGRKVAKAVVDTADAGADVATVVSKTAKAGAEETEHLMSYPAFLKFITELEGSSIRGGMSWLPGSHTLRANAWTSDNPKQPLSKEQLETILNTRRYYKEMHNGEIMPEAEFYKLVAGVCPSWPKDNSGKVIIRSRVRE